MASVSQLMQNSSVRCWSFQLHCHQITYFLTVPFNPRPTDKDGSRIFEKDYIPKDVSKGVKICLIQKKPASTYA